MKNRWIFRRTIIFMLVIMAVSVLSTGSLWRDQGGNPSEVYAKARKKKAPKLSARKLTIYVGKTKVLRVKNVKKAKWKIVSGKKYIKIVNRKKKFIRIRAKKAGVAKIRVKAGGKKLICKVVVKKKSQPAKPPAPVPVSPEDPGPVVDQSGDPVLGNFGFDLLKALHKNGQPNVLISPDSILSALSMTALGADGDTLSGMNQAMHTDDNTKLAGYLRDMHDRLSTSAVESVPLKYLVGNSVWINKDLLTVKDSFLDRTQEYFGAEVYSRPYNDVTLEEINKWASDRTDRMIPKILDHLSPGDRMILLNAICFEGEWVKQYQSSQLNKGTFTTQAGTKSTVTMMDESVTGKYYMELAGGRGFVKYYRCPADTPGKQFAFFAFLPPKGQDMDTYLGKLSGNAFRKAYADRMNRILVTKMPVFSLDYSTSLKTPLAQMGMTAAFTDQADFSGISDQALTIDDVIHKTHIEVDQNGTKAAAVTAVIAKAGAVMQEQIKKEEIILDRPFVYGIMDTRSGQPLFVGTADEIR